MRFRRATASGGWAATEAARARRRLLGRGGRGDAVDQVEAEGLVGADRAGGQQQVLGGGEAAEGDEAGRADRHPEGGAGEAHPQVQPPTRMSQAIAISAPPPTTSPWQAATVGLGNATIAS